MSYISWEVLCEMIEKNTGVRYSHDGVHPQHYGLGVDGKLPYSISEYEFNYMMNFIIKHNLKNGYELATGTGVSTIGIGLGFNKTGGRLISLDSYVEYTEQTQSLGEREKIETVNDAFTFNQKLMSVFGLENTVVLEKGWSPTDSIKLIESLGSKIDFVFLDCPKSAEDFVRDAGYLKDYLADKFAIFVHDTHVYTEEFYKLSLELFGIPGKRISDFEFNDKTYHQHFPLAVITNIGDQ